MVISHTKGLSSVPCLAFHVGQVTSPQGPSTQSLRGPEHRRPHPEHSPEGPRFPALLCVPGAGPLQQGRREHGVCAGRQEGAVQPLSPLPFPQECSLTQLLGPCLMLSRLPGSSQGVCQGEEAGLRPEQTVHPPTDTCTLQSGGPEHPEPG